MRVHALCLVKNESDIIDQCLTAAADWCDHIYVYDNGSTDGTWELVQKLARRVPQVIPFKREDKPFADSLRAEIFEAFRENCSSGDWWCRLDADEFYIDDPRVFLAKVPPDEGVVWTATFSYYFTDADAQRYRSEPSAYDDSVPVSAKCNYYLNHWSEIRFFRHREGLSWEPDAPGVRETGEFLRATGGYPDEVFSWRPYPVRIWVKNYGYRSPRQIERRLATRNPAVRNGHFRYEAVKDWAALIDRDEMRRGRREEAYRGASAQFVGRSWTHRVVETSKLDFDAGDRRFVVNEDLMPSFLRR